MAALDYEIPKDVVPPGAQTGIYYIPISSLPFNVSWQQIKDYVRQVCEVDHVEIFQKSTSGWVRVKGRENFDKAFAHLNGKEFNGRAIIADGRNVDSPILVRDLRVCKPTGSSGRPSSGGGVSTAAASAAPEFPPPHATGGLVAYPDPSMLSSPTSTISSSFSQQGGDYNMSLTPSSYMTSPDASFSDSVMPSGGYHNSHLATGFSAYGFQAPQSFMSPYGPDGGPQAIYGPPASYAVQPPYGDFYPATTGALTNQMASMALGGGVIYTEQRGIQIRAISQRASADQIRGMLREVTGPEAHLINSIEVPTEKDGKTRCLAFVHFATADLARRMARHLNGVEFKGRKLQVRLMKDGDAISGGDANNATLAGTAAGGSSSSSSRLHHRGSKHSSSHHHHQTNKDDRRRAERKDKATSTTSRSSAPLVVGGSVTAKSSSAVKDKGKDKDKHSGSKKSSVVIADGSSGGRRPSEGDKR